MPDDAHDRFLNFRIREQLDFLQMHDDPDATEEDALEDLLEECGQGPGGGCALAGTEFCSFECPFRDDEEEE